MAYTPNPTWNNGGAPGISAAALNNIETEYQEAINSFNQDLVQGFVLSGLACTKDGTTASKLDVALGVAYLLQSDASLRRRSIAATNFSTTSPTTTYYLDLNVDGTLSWGTAHSGTANYLTLCTVVSDGSSNISTVTDTRPTTINLFNGALGTLKFNGSKVWTQANDGSGSGLDADTLRTLVPGNASGNIPTSNGTLNTNLNADMVDGLHANSLAAVAPTGVKIYVQQATPASPNKYDVWFSLPFA